MTHDVKAGADELRMRSLLRSRGVGPDAEPQPDAVAAAAQAAAAQPTASTPATPASTPAVDWWDRLYPAEPEAVAEADETALQPTERSRAGRRRIQPWWTGRHTDLTAEREADDEEVEDDGQDLHEAADLDEDDEDPEKEDEAEEQADGARRPGQARRSRAKPVARRSRPAAATAAPRALVDEPAPRLSLIDAYAAVPARIRWLFFHGSAAAAGYRLGWVDYSTRTAAWIADHHPANPHALFWYGLTVGCVLLYRRMAPTWRIAAWLSTIPIASIATGTLLYGTGWPHLDLELSL